jgi:hypothetical protein
MFGKGLKQISCDKPTSAILPVQGMPTVLNKKLLKAYF